MKALMMMVFSAWIVLVTATVWAANPVNINKASAVDIAANLKGVGAAKAKAIVEYRQKHGPFKSIDGITQVKGVSVRIVEDNKSLLLLR